MKPVEKYIKVMEKKDFAGLAELFTSDGILRDYCSNSSAQNEYHIYGREAINMFSATNLASASILLQMRKL